MLYHDNPFYVLGASLDLDRRGIIALAEEKELLLDSKACAEARTMLTNPQRRINAEVGWFLDCDDGMVEEIGDYIESLERGNFPVIPPVDKYYALTQLNVKVASFDGQNFSSPAATRNYILSISRLYNELRASDIQALINRRRTNSGFPLLQTTAEIDNALSSFRGEIRQILSNRLQKQEQGTYTGIVTRIAESYSTDTRYKGNAILEDAISEYKLYINDTFKTKTDNLTQSADRLSHNLKSMNIEQSLDDLIEDLYDWDRLAQPLQLVEMTRGSIHQNSEAVLLKLRSLALKLHNDGGFTKQALALTNAMQEVFKELPKYEELLSDDAEKLAEMAENASIDAKYSKRFEELKNDAERIQSCRKEELKKRVEAFTASVRNVYSEMKRTGLTNKDVRHIPAYIGRELAINLQNNRNETEIALSLVNELSRVFSDDEEVVERLHQDARDLYKIKLEKEEAEDIKKKIDTVKYQLDDIRSAPGDRLRSKIDAMLSSVRYLNISLRKSSDSSATEAREALAYLVRDTAIDLNNRRHESGMAQLILQSLNSEFGDIAKIKFQIDEDLRILNQMLNPYSAVLNREGKKPYSATVARSSKKNSGSLATDSGSKYNSNTYKGNGKGLLAFIVLAVVGIIIWSTNQQSTSTKSYTSSSPRPSVTAAATKPSPIVTPIPSAKANYILFPVTNGQILKKPDYEGVCPLEIRAGTGSNYYIYLEYKRAPGWSAALRHLVSGVAVPYEEDMAFYVQAGTTVEVDVPVGIYKLYYATGEKFYGTSVLFGDDTQYYSSDEEFDFYADTQYYQGHTLTLYGVTNGNMQTEKIPESNFPK